jgi:uracil-DNA glycosylase
LSERNGNWSAKVLFVAEAPGRLGAEVTGVPLCGDRTGDRFELLLNAMHWNRSAIFVTNAVLCNPRDENGNNDRPTTSELANCSNFLEQTIAVVNPILVVALGRVALESLRKINDHGCTVAKSCGKIVSWGQTHLGVLYHPSPRTQTQRNWSEQISDAVSLSTHARLNLGIESFS